MQQQQRLDGQLPSQPGRQEHLNGMAQAPMPRMRKQEQQVQGLSIKTLN